MALILDTGPLYSSLDRDEADHRRCRELIEGADEVLVIPAPVLPEVDHLVRTRMGPGPMLALLGDIEAGAYLVEDVRPADVPRIRSLLDRYADLGVGFVDAAVLAIVERLGEPKLVTLDHRHFAAMRPRHVDALQLLP
ncbi:MAG TPA: PIN domain-containing protein [Actinomycetota bacterium]|nr:PIN domain-containing protein [Actinomycetota bacterium]